MFWLSSTKIPLLSLLITDNTLGKFVCIAFTLVIVWLLLVPSFTPITVAVVVEQLVIVIGSLFSILPKIPPTLVLFIFPTVTFALL